MTGTKQGICGISAHNTIHRGPRGEQRKKLTVLPLVRGRGGSMKGFDPLSSLG